MRGIPLIVFLSLFNAGASAGSGELAFKPDPAYQNELRAQAAKLAIATDPGWLKLLHYMPRWFVAGGWESQVDSSNFFLSPTGKTDPQVELDATLEAFFSTGPLLKALDMSLPENQGWVEEAQHAQCRFRARYLFLREKLGWDASRLPSYPCKNFDAFAENLHARSVTLVFSSYFLNAPASAFGHTLLRINKESTAKAGKRFELLDQGINFAAVMDTKNPVIYAIKGVFGMFRGTFTNVPYYFKVREYNDHEKRDLWEYDLELTQPELDLLVAHVWELGPSYYDYYYLDENCSYHMLTILEAAAPRLHLTDRLPSIVIPVDTVRAASAEKGLVIGIHYRPSVYRQFETRRQRLSGHQSEWLESVVHDRDPRKVIEAPEATDEDRVQVLDAALDYVDYEKAKELGENDPEANAWKQKLLQARSTILKPSEDLRPPYPAGDEPHAGHRSRRAGLGVTSNSVGGAAITAKYRFALHDLLDAPAGYPQGAQIEFFSGELRMDPGPDPQAWVEDLAIFRVESLNPFGAFNRKLSWRIRAGYARTRDAMCTGSGDRGCGLYVVDIGRGLTLATADGRASAYAQVDFETSAGRGLEDGRWLRLGAGPALGLRWVLGNSLVFLTEGRYRFYPIQWGHHPHGWQAKAGLRWELVRDFAWDVHASVQALSSEAGADVLLYF